MNPIFFVAQLEGMIVKTAVIRCLQNFQLTRKIKVDFWSTFTRIFKTQFKKKLLFVYEKVFFLACEKESDYGCFRQQVFNYVYIDCKVWK